MNLKKDDVRNRVLSDNLNRQREEALKKHDHYWACMLKARDIRDGPINREVIDFAQKVCLSRLLRHPGLLYFIKEMNFDLFGVHSFNSRQSIVLDLIEE